jgi:predicted helicase
LHSLDYRSRYSEPLKIDFPRVPLTSDASLFRQLVYLGRELIALHLMESPVLENRLTHFPIPGTDEVAARGGYPKYIPASEGQGGRVKINREQYFEGVPANVWQFEIGGYQVLHKWLKDRRGRRLDYDDKVHYQKIVVALAETMRLMGEIDDAIPAWPIE